MLACRIDASSKFQVNRPSWHRPPDAAMDRDQAERSLAIIRSVIENTRDDLIERNWGVIWMLHSFINLAAAASGTWIDRRELNVFWYAVPLVVGALANIVVALLFMSREQGV